MTAWLLVLERLIVCSEVIPNPCSLVFALTETDVPLPKSTNGACSRNEAYGTCVGSGFGDCCGKTGQWVLQQCKHSGKRSLICLLDVAQPRKLISPFYHRQLSRWQFIWPENVFFISAFCAIGNCIAGNCPGLGYSTDGFCGDAYRGLMCGGSLGTCCSNAGR